MPYIKRYLSYPFIIFILLAAGCGKETPKETPADYKSEAIALCEVFNPDKWRDMPANPEPAEIQTMLANKIAAAVKSEKMKQIIDTIPTVPMNLRYQYVVESVSALTGEPYTCPGMKDYFNP